MPSHNVTQTWKEHFLVTRGGGWVFCDRNICCSHSSPSLIDDPDQQPSVGCSACVEAISDPREAGRPVRNVSQCCGVGGWLVTQGLSDHRSGPQGHN